METASFSGIIRTLILLILIYYAIRFLFRIFAPVILQQVVKKAERSFYEQQQNRQNTQQQPFNTNTFRPKEKKKVGEYIDYEEIE